MPHIVHLSSVHRALDTRIFYREARSAQRAGYRVTVIAPHDRDEVRDGVQILALPRTRRLGRPLLWVALLRRALAARADLYHFHDPELLLVVPWLRLITAKPAIYDVHEPYADFIRLKRYIPALLRGPLAWAFGRAEPLLARLQSGLIFAVDEIAGPFRGLRCPKATLFNFPEASFVQEALEATRGNDIREPIILHLGGHERSRGTDLMIEAFAQVARVRPEARLWLVGPFFPPSLEQEVRAEIAKRGLSEAVLVTGQVPFAEVGHYLRQAAVGWMPAQPLPKYQVSVPTKIFEYMAYAVPVVSSDLQAVRPFIRHGENGYLVQGDDPTAHAQAILALLQDAARAQDMGRRGQELVKRCYNWAAMEERLLALYREVLG